MQRNIPTQFSGMLDLQGNDDGKCDSFFSILDNTVSLIPLTNECKKQVHKLSYTDGSVDNPQWHYGFSDDSCSVAFLRTKRLSTGISAPVDVGTAKFRTPMIVKSTHTDNLDLRAFDCIEFRGGIVDILHTPAWAVRNNCTNNCIAFVDKSNYTHSYVSEISGETFRLTYSVDIGDLSLETGKIPDLRTAIHSVVRFDFESEKKLDEIERYYSYAMSLFQFCAGQLNVGFEIRLYKKTSRNGANVAKPALILVQFIDGFKDYANDKLDFTQVIRLTFWGDKLPCLLKTLVEKNTQPRLMFLPNQNSEVGHILYTQISDICVSFEREFDCNCKNVAENDKSSDDILSLYEKLVDFIKETSYSDDIKNRANGIIGNLKHKSLKMKIMDIYSSFESHIKQITEQKGHDKLEISKFYTSEEFEQKVRKFVDIRNKTAHVGIVWNEGAEIFTHLKILVYFNILQRSGYSADESAQMLSWLFNRFF